jgi:tetratricopeptide (TPR) repeat protein
MIGGAREVTQELLDRLDGQDALRVVSAAKRGQQGQFLLDNGDSESAAREYDAALKELAGAKGVAPLLLIFRAKLVTAYGGHGQYKDAIRVGEEAIRECECVVDVRLDLIWAELLQNLGAAYANTGNLDKAKQLLDKALEIYERSPEGFPGAEAIRNSLRSVSRAQGHRGWFSRLFDI